jgi:ATP-dependent Clp protease adaptor protein ClpS
MYHLSRAGAGRVAGRLILNSTEEIERGAGAALPGGMADERRKRSTDVADRPEQQLKQPPLFRVVLHNDDYTTMDFVISVLETVFLKHPAEAYRVMMHVHCHGRGECGVYPHEIAETKVGQVHTLARERGYPLQATIEDA